MRLWREGNYGVVDNEKKSDERRNIVEISSFDDRLFFLWID